MKKIIFPYYQKFEKIFEKEKTKIFKVLKNTEVHHIGSTSVSGLGGKGIIDMMVAIKSWQELETVVEKLKKIGFKHIHPKRKGEMFLSKIGPTKFGDVHIHMVKKDNKPYKNYLAFRDYLRENKKEVQRFFKSKLKWEKQASGDRTKYGKLKGEYVREILKKSTNIKIRK